MLLVIPKALQNEAPTPTPQVSTAQGGADFTSLAVPPSVSTPEPARADGLLSEVQLLDLRQRVLSGADVTKEELQAAVRTLRAGRNSIASAPAAPISGLPPIPGLPAL